MPHPQGRSPDPTRGPRVVFFVGLAILAVGIILFVAGLWGVTDGLEDGIGSDTHPVGSSLEVPEEPGASSSVDVNLTEERYLIFAEFEMPLEPESFRSSPDVELAVTGPGGEPVVVEASELVPTRALFNHQVASFHTDEAGIHELHVTRAEPTTEAETDLRATAVEIRRVERGEGTGRVLAGATGTALGVLTGIVGFLLFVIGGIWWLIVSTKALPPDR